MTMNFPAGAMLTVLRHAESYDKLGNRALVTSQHQIGPCDMQDSHGAIVEDQNGLAKWVGTVTVTAPPNADVQAADEVLLPNGSKAVIVSPPVKPRNPFTGWQPFTQFTLSTPGYTPAHT